MKKQKKLTKKQLNIYCQQHIMVSLNMLEDGKIIPAFRRLKELCIKLGEENTE